MSIDERAPTTPIGTAINGQEFANTTHAVSTRPEHDEPVVTRKEMWSYLLYVNGNNGNGPVYYSFTLFQALATSAGYNPKYGPEVPCNPFVSGNCVLPWARGTKSVDSIVLISSGLTFMFLTLIFTTIGSLADYGDVSRWFLLGLTIICWAAQYASVALVGPGAWKWSMALYIISAVSYGATLMFYTAVFPRLARNTPRTRELHSQYDNGAIDIDEFELEISMERNRISNVMNIHSNLGYLFSFCLNLAVLFPLANDPRVDGYTIVLSNSYWVILGIWWFIFQKPRPGPPVPKGGKAIAIGWLQIWQACREWRKLPHTFFFLAAFFFLADGANTTATLLVIIQNNQFQFSFLKNTYFGIVRSVASVVGCTLFYLIQRRWKINTKTMLCVTTVTTVLIPLWGMIGIWTTKIGFHNSWEFWVSNTIYGLFQAAFTAFAQTVMAELTPHGYYNMFYGLFGISNVASSIIGPNVIQAIIDKRNNNWEGFTFLFALNTVACIVIWFFVDVKKGAKDANAWAEDRKAQMEKEGATSDAGSSTEGNKNDILADYSDKEKTS
ncbi:hypothetical protein BOTBODRAFT_285619 [Botryobasidium botryosum FD-172 SS1]|uniref:Autophagy-related protein n=1 Tax=Botryobasidium botryosum (strain FD-172 SS1) TaxID=930990 RepID=A0A067MJF9_BOTB1|nr:hypothetical protein BOTBODRAFT_285619 [Botryobasidium botryosum FD-172 SS1]